MKKSKLDISEVLDAGQQLWSPNSEYMLEMQSDGNLVLYRMSDSKPLWSTGTQKKGGKRIGMQDDGNLVLYTDDGKPVWASGTDHKAGTLGVFAQLQDDGNFVIYARNSVPVSAPADQVALQSWKTVLTPIWTKPDGAVKKEKPQVIGAIRKKWLALGGEQGFLGQPLTNEQTTPDGHGRYNHFQGGSIYWTKSAGAFEVHGAIREWWSSLGWERSYLGYPISDEMDFPEGGKVSVFQNGSIYWWQDTGAIDLKGVVVHYTGLVCFGETDEPTSSSDEPYAVFGVVSPDGAFSYKTKVYEDVDGGESRPDLLEIYQGKPNGLTISVLLMEHDEGNPDEYRDLVKSYVNKGLDGAKAALPYIPVVGPVLAEIGGPVLDFMKPRVEDGINKILDTGDDRIGLETIYISPKRMVILAARTPNQVERGVGYKEVTPLMSGDGGSYKVYFGIVPT